MTDLDCNEFVEFVTSFLDGALDADTEGRVVGHLATCDGCERYLDQFRQTIRTLGDLPADSAPADSASAEGLPAEGLPPQARDALLAAFRSWAEAG